MQRVHRRSACAILALSQRQILCEAKLSRHYLTAPPRSKQPLESYATKDQDLLAPDTGISKDAYRKHRASLKEKFPEGWNPPRKISREAMDGLRALHGHDPHTFSTPVLAEKFKISPEAVRRILKSKWSPSREEMGELLERDRKRKQAYIAARKEKEKQEQWEKVDSIVAAKEVAKEAEEDGLELR